MKNKILFYIVLLTSALSANATHFWFSANENGPTNTLPTLKEGTTVANNDVIALASNKVELTANPTTATSLSTQLLFSGSRGQQGDADILLGSNFAWTISALNVESFQTQNKDLPNMLSGSVVNIKGVSDSNVGSVSFSGMFNISNAVNTKWNISANTSFSGSSEINIGSNNTADFSNITSWSGSRAIKIGSGSSLTMVYKGSYWKTFDINGLTVDGGTFDLSSSQSGRSIMITGTNEIKLLSSEAKFGWIRLGGSLTISSDVEYALRSANSNFSFDNNGSLTINKENAFVTDDADGLIGLQCTSNGASASLILGASNAFTELFSGYAQGATFTITLAGNTLTFGSIDTAKFKEIIVSDFQDGLIRITDKSSVANVNLNLFTAIENGKKVEQLGWADKGSYMALIAIPEPSTYAMIFGAIALGFVAYRRAKVRGRA